VRMHDEFHVSPLKPNYRDHRGQPPPPAIMVDGKEDGAWWMLS